MDEINFKINADTSEFKERIMRYANQIADLQVNIALTKVENKMLELANGSRHLMETALPFEDTLIYEVRASAFEEAVEEIRKLKTCNKLYEEEKTHV